MRVTLDLDDPREVALWIVKAYNISFEAPDYLRDVASQLEAQAPPVRMKEPGLWGIVEAIAPLRNGGIGVARRWVRDEQGWIAIGCLSAIRVSGFEYLIEPALIREGLPA